ncbi:BCL2-interacting killer (apoptosis-inducing) [Labeo rohita]|uniref:BCL2-interacting killer (Apoptosis-inducing) n=1 Tax=Labeo rohita TaxID=84645 RepID=A0A498MN74_LABRO|nr:bcl-2-interacting killer [Labeo rohita]RXN17795.1 BCL2-interacting killer (apoptosis-inducing) [Labeo rohita]RXN21243.1 BCL2-interacting killer (apoptosis-inducing) [Labeo rohita]
MVEETKQRKNATSLQAGPGEVDHNTLYAINMRVSQLIGRQLAQIGDEMDYKWRERLPVLRQPLNFIGIYPYALTRRAFSGILGNIWGSKIMPMLRTSWLVPQLQNGCQEAKKWAAWVSSLHVSDWSRKTTCILASALLLVTVSIFLITWNEYEG